MKRELFSCFVVAALAAIGTATQQDTSPAPQVKKFEPLIGSFQGGGTAVMAPGTEPTKWTATVKSEWILGGHFVQQDENIQTTQGPLIIRSIYGWDSELQKPVCYGVSNMGPMPGEVRWTDDKTLVNVWHGTLDGTPFIERWTMKFDDKGYAFTLDKGIGDGQFTNHVTGRFDRTTKIDGATGAETGAPAPGPELKLLQPMIGQWNLTGKVDVPGMSLDISANETIDWLYGGAVMVGHVKSEPEGYLSNWYIAYDHEASCYRQLYANNMGQIAWQASHFIDGKLVATDANKQNGVPGVDRSVIEFGNGGITRAYADRIAGAGEPSRTFQATYKRVGGGPATIEAKFSAGSCCAKAAAAGGACAHPCCVTATKEGKICEKCNN